MTGLLRALLDYIDRAKRALSIVNREVLSVDRAYVLYSWASDSISGLKRLGLLVSGGVLVGKTLQAPAMSWPLVVTGLIGYGIYLVAENLIGTWAQERRALFDNILTTRMETRRTEHLATLDLGRLVDQEFIELSAMTERRGTGSIQALWSVETECLGTVISLVASGSILLGLDPLLGVLAICMAAPRVVSTWFTEEKRRRLDESENLTRMERSEIHESITRPHPAVLSRVLRFTDQYLAHYRTLTSVLDGNVRQLAKYERRSRTIVSLISIACFCSFGLYFASGLVDGRYTYAAIGAIAGSLLVVESAVHSFGWTFGRFEQKMRDYAYLEKFFGTKPLVDESACKPYVPSTSPEIVIEDLCFAYPSSDRRAIEQVALSIQPGEKVALVGPNGCGKTTLLRLISRIYNPDEGRIWANEHALDMLTQRSWLDHLVMMPQAPRVPDLALCRALTGEDTDKIDMPRLGTALTLSNSAPIVNELPLGLDTWIGEFWPNGRGFSTGQGQRLALAAAFYRLLEPQVHIALFDEPTANCDAETKLSFYSSLSHAPEFAEKTIIVSLHDPLYLQFFDRVLRFENGRLVQDLRGAHDIERYRSEISLALAHDL